MALVETGQIESLDGWAEVSWDHTHSGMATYLLTDRESGGRYVCHWSSDLDNWVLAPEHMATVDMERQLPNDPSDELWWDIREVLNRAKAIADGKQPSGIVTMKADKP